MPKLMTHNILNRKNERIEEFKRLGLTFDT